MRALTSIFKVSTIAALCLFANVARAQDLDEVSFAGVVSDESGAVIPGATVTARSSTTGADARGRDRRRRALSSGRASARRVHAARERAGFADGHERGKSSRSPDRTCASTSRSARGRRRRADNRERRGRARHRHDAHRRGRHGHARRDGASALLLTRSPLDFVFLLGGVTEEPLSTRDAAEDRDERALKRAASARRPKRPARSRSRAARPTRTTSPSTGSTTTTTAPRASASSRRSTRSKRCRSSPTSSPPSTAAPPAAASTSARAPARTSCAGRLSYFFRDESLDANTWNNNRRGLKRLPLQEHPRLHARRPLVLPAHLGPVVYDGRGRTFFFVAYEHEHVLDSR
jgi:hypothetical protein